MNLIPRIIAIRDRARIKGMRAQKSEDMKTIAQIHKLHAADFAQVRIDERRRFEPQIEERDREIARLHEEMNGQRRYFQQVSQIGFEFTSSVDEVGEQKRARYFEGHQMNCRGNEMTECKTCKRPADGRRYRVLESPAGHYIGTLDDQGMPSCRITGYYDKATLEKILHEPGG